MVRKSASAGPPIPHAPMRLDWTEDRLRTLSQEQLLNLLANLDRQRRIGRVSSTEAAAVDQRIMGLLTSRNSAKRLRQLQHAGAVTTAEPQ
ncbi:MAG: hypothetical protein JSW31_00830 [Burkholderiales bacterium]|jgi:hypothetical protein|nr:MAG: hypothetical protein JSW31_00830 [Burkholderiales bacterium]